MKLCHPGTWQETDSLSSAGPNGEFNEGATSLKVGWLREPARDVKRPKAVATAGSCNHHSQGQHTGSLEVQGNSIVEEAQ